MYLISKVVSWTTRKYISMLVISNYRRGNVPLLSYIETTFIRCYDLEGGTDPLFERIGVLMAVTDSQKGCAVYPVVVPTRSSLKTFNFYLVEDSGSLTMIDAGVDSDKSWELFQKALTDNGFTLNDISRILLTHNHQDHVGLVNRITSLRDIPVYAHAESIYRLKREESYFSMRVRFFKQLYQEMGCGDAGERQVQYLQETVRWNEKFKIQADILPLAESDRVSRFRVIETPGHSHDHVVFLDEERNELFVGDHVLHHISSNALVEPDRNGKRIKALVEYVDSLKKCVTLDVGTLYTGHGELVRNHKELITTRLNRIEEKASKFLDLIRRGKSTADALARTYYHQQYESEFSLVMSEIIGHLDYLEAQNKVQKERRDGVWHYFSV